jgi:hypothetical protein
MDQEFKVHTAKHVGEVEHWHEAEMASAAGQG